jgi:predicted secreted protein
MAFRHGRFAEITVNSVALSSFCDQADISIEIDDAEVTTFGNNWKRYIAGLAGASVELSGNWDPTTTSGPASALTSLIGDDAFAVILEPGGAAVNQSRTFNAILTKYEEGTPVGDKITFSATLLVDGAVTFES